MSRPKLYLGTIFMDRGAVPAFYYSLLDLERSGLVDIKWSMHGHGDGAMRQLNRRVADFLENTTCDFFWLQGNDTDFQPEYIHHMATLGHPVIAGLFPIKQPSLRWCYQALADAERHTDLATGALEVRSAGLECIMIHRDVFTALRASRPDLDYADNASNGPRRKLHHHWRWELTPKEGPWEEKILQSEDYFICDEIRALGYKIMLDTTGYCGHWDCRVRFPLTPPEPAANLKKPYGEGIVS